MIAGATHLDYCNLCLISPPLSYINCIHIWMIIFDRLSYHNNKTTSSNCDFKKYKTEYSSLEAKFFLICFFFENSLGAETFVGAKKFFITSIREWNPMYMNQEFVTHVSIFHRLLCMFLTMSKTINISSSNYMIDQAHLFPSV